MLSPFRNLKQDWFGNIRGDVLSGLVVALALIPEAIAFSITAGVDPKVGLYASFCIAVIISIVGGRPGMISAATGAMALLMGSLVREHGLEYLLAATILTGIIQIIAGWLKLGSLLRFVSKSVMTGFVNALAILIFMAQLHEFHNATWQVYAMVAAGLAIIYLLPRITKAVPSPLVAIILLTGFSIYMGLDIRTVGDMGELPNSIPVFFLPNIPLNWETLVIIFPYAVSLAAVGLLESLMTAAIVDDMTDTKSDKNQECKGQGMANIVAGMFGGMAGCAMIGQSVINVKSGGRGRLSTFLAGMFLLFLILVMQQWVERIPMAALVAVMIMVSISTFSWKSIADMRTIPISSTIVMLSTVAVMIYTHNLAQGVFVGVLMSALFFAFKVSRYMSVEIAGDTKNAQTYTIYGQVFFASASRFAAAFDFDAYAQNITIDVSYAHFWDLSAVAALDKVVLKYRNKGSEVTVKGLNKASQTLVTQLGIHDKKSSENLVNTDTL